MHCICPFCAEPRRPMFLYTESALEWLCMQTDERHKRPKVFAFIELYYRAGVFDPRMPYVVWLNVMGPNELPPFAYNGIGAFQLPRSVRDRDVPIDYEQMDLYWWDLPLHLPEKVWSRLRTRDRNGVVH
jgi:hypothetical protein